MTDSIIKQLDERWLIITGPYKTVFSDARSAAMQVASLQQRALDLETEVLKLQAEVNHLAQIMDATEREIVTEDDE